MGHKVNPTSFRTSVIYGWPSKWFAHPGPQLAKLLREDQEVRGFLQSRLKEAAVDRIMIDRTGNDATVTIQSAKPGVVIGRGGAGIEDLRKELVARFFPKEKRTLKLNIEEVRKPALSASIVMQGMTADLERRMPFRRVLKQTVDRVMRGGAKGVKVRVSGRLNGAEIARTETLSSGSIPLHTLRADIDYAQGFARTIYGAIGVKVWIYRGLVFEKEEKE